MLNHSTVPRDTLRRWRQTVAYEKRRCPPPPPPFSPSTVNAKTPQSQTTDESSQGPEIQKKQLAVWEDTLKSPLYSSTGAPICSPIPFACLLFCACPCSSSKLLMSVPLCHSSFGARWKRLMKSTNFSKNNSKWKRFSFLSWNREKDKKSTSAYTDIAVILYVCLTLTDFLCFLLNFFWKHMLLYWFFLCRVQYFSHFTVSHPRRSAICRRIIMKHSHFCRTFISNCKYSSNDLPSPNLSQRSCCVPFLSKPLHKPLFAMCLCYVAYTDQAKHCDHKKS